MERFIINLIQGAALYTIETGLRQRRPGVIRGSGWYVTNDDMADSLDLLKWVEDQADPKPIIMPGDSWGEVRRLRNEANNFGRRGDMLAASLQDQAASSMAKRLMDDERINPS